MRLRQWATACTNSAGWVSTLGCARNPGPCDGSSLLRPRPHHSRSRWTRVDTQITPGQLVLDVPAANVKCKGLDQAMGKALAPELLSTRGAARIPALEDIDSQRRLAFQHAPLCHNNG
jgi:hypothetical protein